MTDGETPRRFDRLAAAAERYGGASLENYSIVRSAAEQMADGFCKFLGHDRKCVYLVPPEGAWAPGPYQSGAFSVSGQGFLPLEPISFGLGVRVSNTGDWIRIVITAAKQGPDLDLSIEGGADFAFRLPIDDKQLQGFFDALLAHLVSWFAEQADNFEDGAYGGGGMGFDFIHADDALQQS